MSFPKNKKHPNRKNWSGQKFGNLTAIKFIRSDDRGTQGKQATWLFQCDCGNSIERVSSVVVSGNTKSCGCRKAGRYSQFDTVRHGRYLKHCWGARKRNIDNFLTEEQWTEIASRPCVYCGEFTIRRNSNTGGTLPLNSVDRRDNEKFYTLENSQPVCVPHQFMKQDFTDAEFRELVRKTYRFLREG
jgi:hypothetical protein